MGHNAIDFFSLKLYFRVLTVLCGLLWSLRFFSVLDTNFFLIVIILGWSSSKSLQFTLNVVDINCPKLINKRNDELKKLGSRNFMFSGFDVNILRCSKADVFQAKS